MTAAQRFWPASPGRWRRPLALASALAGMLVSACATYAPSRLGGEADQVLAGPDPRVVVADAARLSHPRLKPLAIDLSRPLSPEALGIIAVVANPELKAARAKAGVSDAQVFAAGLLPDPTITLGTDHILSGPDTTDALTGQIAFDLAALRDRRAAVAGARAAREQVRFDLAWQEWQTAGQARLLAARIGGLQQALTLDQHTKVAADAMLDRVLTAAARGDVRADEVETRRLATADAADKARQAERDLQTARLALNRLLGLRPETPLAIAPAAETPSSLDAEALFARAREARLDLLALESGYASQEAAVRKAVLDQFPNLQLTITRARDTTGNQTLGPSVNFTLPVWNANRGGIAVARATREQLRAEYAARLYAARADIADLTGMLSTEERQRDEIAAQVEPLSRIVAQTEAAVGRGDIARATADAARQTVVDKALVLAALDQAIAEQSVALELAVGASLEP